jgi:hypothetical protein
MLAALSAFEGVGVVFFSSLMFLRSDNRLNKFSEIELPPQEPHPSVVVGAKPFASEPPAAREDG